VELEGASELLDHEPTDERAEIAELLPGDDRRSVRVPETRFGVSERALARSSGDDLMLLLAV
jgi:hypothetical protein